MSSIAKKKTARTNDEPIRLRPVDLPQRRTPQQMAIETLALPAVTVQELYSRLGSMASGVPDGIDGEDFAALMGLVRSIECDLREATSYLTDAAKVAS